MDSGETFDNNKQSIILLHGSGQSHIVWSLTAQYLTDQNYNVFALDFPGHGNSEGESLKTIEDMAEWLNKVIFYLKIKDFTLVGHSQGCLVALEYASKYSANLKNHSDFSDLCDSLKLTMIDQNISPNCSIQNQNNQGIRS